MKQSLQCYYNEQVNENHYNDFLNEMKLLRQKT